MFDVNTGIETADELEMKADSIMKNDPYYQKDFSQKLNYYIIAHKLDSIIGPLTYPEYLGKKKELGIPNNLNLEVVKI